MTKEEIPENIEREKKNAGNQCKCTCQCLERCLDIVDETLKLFYSLQLVILLSFSSHV